ncbi:MAG: lysophospholipid acyltransferase family protein [Pseudomonadota bacterium]
MASPLVDAFRNAFFRTIIKTALVMPYRQRVSWAGRVTATLVAPLSGWRNRIRINLEHVMPELPEAERQGIIREVTDNVGRTLIEIYSGRTFLDRIQDIDMTGPGFEAFQAARATGRPVVLVTAHLGNYDVVRGKLYRDGHPIAALYKPMENKAFNAHYVKAISTIAEPVYPTTGQGLARLVRHLRSGGIVGIVADVGSRRAPVLSFFDKPAHTPLSAAELAVKFDAVMIPVFGIRQADGFSFFVEFADPIANTEPAEMMQRYNDTVETYARRYPGQWFWLHRRWKGLNTKFAVSEDP